MEGFLSNLNDTFTSTMGCTELMLSMCQLKVKVTVKGKIFDKQILHIMSCPLYNSFTNGRISSNLNDTFTSTRGCAEIKLMKGKALRKHSLHEKTAASVLLKLFISGNE